MVTGTNGYHSLDLDRILRCAWACLGITGGRTFGVVNVFSEDEWLILAGFSVRGTPGRWGLALSIMSRDGLGQTETRRTMHK